MLFTYSYKDKGPANKLAVRSNQRHLTKSNSIVNIPGKPNPIKHWRKQLSAYVPNSAPIQSKTTIQDLDDAIKTSAPSCKGYQDILYVDKCIGVKGSNPCNTGSFQVKHSANTIINKKFCWNSKQYLQSRCKTFDQNATIGKHLTESGPEYRSGSCPIDPSCNIVIYKPNNKQFAQQGGVSSSARIAKLKYDTLRGSTSKYDSFLANLDSSNSILSRKPVKCINWVRRGVRKDNLSCPQIIRLNNI